MIVLDSPDGRERILILQRADGRFTYCKQSRATDPAAEDSWDRPGPDLGIYDSLLTAETEARQRVGWLKAQFH